MLTSIFFFIAKNIYFFLPKIQKFSFSRKFFLRKIDPKKFSFAKSTTEGKIFRVDLRRKIFWVDLRRKIFWGRFCEGKIFLRRKIFGFSEEKKIDVFGSGKKNRCFLGKHLFFFPNFFSIFWDYTTKTPPHDRCRWRSKLKKQGNSPLWVDWWLFWSFWCDSIAVDVNIYFFFAEPESVNIYFFFSCREVKDWWKKGWTLTVLPLCKPIQYPFTSYPKREKKLLKPLMLTQKLFVALR